MNSIVELFKVIKEPLLLLVGIGSGILLHILKCRYDEKSKIKERSRQVNITIAERIKELALQIDDIVDKINLEEPDFEAHKQHYLEWGEITNKIHKEQRLITDSKLDSLITEFTVTFAFIRMLHSFGVGSLSELIERHGGKFSEIERDEKGQYEACFMYFDSFENLINYINSKL